jgi:putative glutamine amidotransferase
MTRPRILVTCWRRPLPTYLGERTILDTLDPAYAAHVADAGGLPLIVSRPPGSASLAVDEALSLADGLLLTGGGDVDPTSYGAEPENVDDLDARADEWELALIAAARELVLPTLAICRGAQLLAVAHGGRLAQRLSAGDGHRELGGMTPDAILAARHPVDVVPGSRVRRALGGSERIAVNTIHHHEIADAGELEVTATAPGGVIEAVEPRSEWPCVGVQWHPEKMHEPEQMGLFAQLVDAAQAGSGAPAAHGRAGARA